MNEQRSADKALSADLQALRRATAVELPTMEETVRAVTRQRTTREETIMSTTIRSLTQKPWLTTAAAAVVIALALLVVPVSYERTVGHDIRVSLDGTLVDQDQIQALVTDLESSLEAEGVRVRGLGDRTVIEVGSPIRSRDQVEASAARLTSTLAGEGLAAEVSIRPRVERVTGNVYAAARWRIVGLEVRRSGRSPAEVEQDLRAQLAAAGYEDPQVSVELAPDQTSIRIESTTDQGSGSRQLVRRMVRRGDGGDFNVQMKDLDYQPEPGMTDEEIRQDILRELDSQGIHDAEVTVENGRIEIRAEKREDCN